MPVKKTAPKKGYHKDGPVMDSPEQIERCLNCPFPTCSNCVYDAAPAKSAPSLFFTAYIEKNTDEQIAEVIQKSVATVQKYRRAFHLPTPRRLNMGERKVEVDRVKASGVRI